MREICSSENKIYKTCKQLSEKKHRDKLGLYLIEGDNALSEVLKNEVDIDFVLVPEHAKENFLSKFPELEEKGILLPDKLFNSLSETETPQGFLTAVKKGVLDKESFLDKVKDKNILVLDRLQDPGNIGTIIRTADAAGYGGIIFLKGSADPYAPKVVRAAAGSVFRTPIFFADNPKEVLAIAKESGKRVFATGFNTDKYYYDVDLKKDAMVLIGNEGNGLCDELFTGADVIIKIPMEGNIDSLNAAVAAALIMYETKR